MPKIHPKKAQAIIKSLEAGVVPRLGIQHLLVGRKAEIEEIIDILDNTASGSSDIRLWIGDFGSGKSFMLKTIESLALQKNFVVSTVDLTPTRRFYANDKKAKALYSEIASNLSVQSSMDGGALGVILERFVGKLIEDYSRERGQDAQAFYQLDQIDGVSRHIINTVTDFYTAGLSYEFGQAIAKYYEGIARDNAPLKLIALRWLRADIDTKTESKQSLGITRIIDDDTWYDAIKNLTELFTGIGYAGFVINFDEVVNLYKIPRAQSRERNYERILNMYNECKTDKVKGLFINFGATGKTVYDERRGMVSYGALKGRLGKENGHTDKWINTKKTALKLKLLTVEEIYVLLENLGNIYSVHYKIGGDFEQADIHFYMEEQLNRPGAEEFLTPRCVIKDFLEIMDLARQNSLVSKRDIIHSYFGKKPKAVTKDSDDHDDIEIF